MPGGMRATAKSSRPSSSLATSGPLVSTCTVIAMPGRASRMRSTARSTELEAGPVTAPMVTCPAAPARNASSSLAAACSSISTERARRISTSP